MFVLIYTNNYITKKKKNRFFACSSLFIERSIKTDRQQRYNVVCEKDFDETDCAKSVDSSSF